MPIVIAPLGCDLKIVKVIADDKTKKHLQDIGISPNQTIQVIQSNKGNVIVIVKGVRLALDKSVATKIIVA